MSYLPLAIMIDDTKELAFFGLGDGSFLVGYGPFSLSEKQPKGEIAFYVNDFALKEKNPWRMPARWEILNVLDFFPVMMAEVDWQSPDAGAFAAVFQQISDAIRGGVFEKTVPVAVETGVLKDGSAREIGLAFTQVGGFKKSYGWIDGDTGFAGATPEVLFELKGKNLRTMALAGTARYDEREILAVDQKEIREHEYVAQTLVVKLAEMGTLKRKDRGILDLGPIVHFQTMIDVDLYDEPSIDSLIKKMHPTPALGPLPRTNETMKMLLDWRHLLGCPVEFGAPFGLLFDGVFRSVVAIRGIWWHDNCLKIPSGCGVIEASRVVSEWRELRLKRDAVKSTIGLT
jgi:menaquinone-specific isochorismate synthase